MFVTTMQIMMTDDKKDVFELIILGFHYSNSGWNDS